ncbi:MAG: hypothetical protein CML43_14000 [Rhodobacteraceae bacterium]|nr:hypothetical protein [Paracoccaceae bacterium]
MLEASASQLAEELDGEIEEPDEESREAEMVLRFGDQILLYDAEHNGFVFNATSGCVAAPSGASVCVCVCVGKNESEREKGRESDGKVATSKRQETAAVEGR